MPQCPLYEDVLDTQMFGFLAKLILQFVLDLLMKLNGKILLDELETELLLLHDLSIKK